MQYLAVLILALMFAAAPVGSVAQDIHEHEFVTADNLGPGDKGFAHEEMHPYYQMIFDSGRCYCHTGECRPTKWRSAPESPTGVQMLLNREWVNIPEHAFVKKESVPPELWAFPAHICAFYYEGRLNVECAIIIAGI